MKALITGADGQLGRELVALSSDFGISPIPVGQELLDILYPEAIRSVCDEYAPDVVINAAAYTAVDKAESDIDLAYAVNRDGPGNIAKICAERGVPLVHVSTDYVFDGSKQGAYSESDIPQPLGVYGQSKYAGEQAIREIWGKHYIFRTSWVFSSHGNNFVKTMLKLGQERDQLSIVDDQHGKPTCARELARIIFEVLVQDKQNWGLYHVAQSDVVSWHGFATAIFAEATRQGMVMAIRDVRAIPSSEYPTPAPRPINSELECKKFEQEFGVNIRPWSDSLLEVIRELAQEID